MCGRTACTLNPSALCSKCKYRNKDGSLLEPQWRDSPPAQDQYTPKYNFAPTNFGPVLVSASHFAEDSDYKEDRASRARLITPMKWGLIPSWSKGARNPYSMINARAETLMHKTSYKTPLTKGRRCVVIADGFYEWAKKGKEKQPYFIHAPKNDYNNIEDRPLLYMAGVFDKCKDDKGVALYSYSVITVDSANEISWMHDRMPAILDNEDEVSAWLDYQNIPLDEALLLLRPSGAIEYHPVDKAVGNVHLQGAQCIKQVQIEGHDSHEVEAKQSNLNAFFKPKRESKPEKEHFYGDSGDIKPDTKKRKI